MLNTLRDAIVECCVSGGQYHACPLSGKLHLGSVSIKSTKSHSVQHFEHSSCLILQIWNAATQEGSTGPASRLHSALMAVLTHMVGRLGAVAIQDPHIQAVLYALLQRGLDGTPAQQEVLVEDAVKLLNATLAASSSVGPSLQVNTLECMNPVLFIAETQSGCGAQILTCHPGKASCV